MRTFIIAEAGVNHNGDEGMALELVRAARDAGADAVKFQTFHAEELVTRSAPKAKYQQKNDSESSSQYEMLKRLELSEAAHKEIIDECKRLGIEFMSTPFSVSSARFLASLGMRIWKIPSGEITNLPLLEYVASVAERIIMSTGMATMDEIRQAVEVILHEGFSHEKLYLLHCTTAYPTALKDVNLRAMARLNELNPAGTGYSDHTRGIIVPAAAVAMGAVIIEKHITLDNNLPGPDHRASLNPEEFKRMVTAIREVEIAKGEPVKEPTASERENIPVARKSIVAARAIRMGESFTASNLTAKRPGNGISPMEWYNIIGREAKKDYDADQQISIDELI